jgi:hypothetical protein
MSALLISSNVLLAEAAVIALEQRGERVTSTYLDALPHSHPIAQLRIVMALLSVASSASVRCTIVRALGVLGPRRPPRSSDHLKTTKIIMCASGWPSH